MPHLPCEGNAFTPDHFPLGTSRHVAAQEGLRRCDKQQRHHAGPKRRARPGGTNAQALRAPSLTFMSAQQQGALQCLQRRLLSGHSYSAWWSLSPRRTRPLHAGHSVSMNGQCPSWQLWQQREQSVSRTLRAATQLRLCFGFGAGPLDPYRPHGASEGRRLGLIPAGRTPAMP